MNKHRILIIIISCIIIFSTTGCFGLEEEKIYGAKDWVGTKWKNTDGYELEIFDNKCEVSKDGKKMANVCNFTIDSNNSGVGKLEICNRFGSDCDDRELASCDHCQPDANFYLWGTRWYRQDE